MNLRRCHTTRIFLFVPITLVFLILVLLELHYKEKTSNKDDKHFKHRENGFTAHYRTKVAESLMICPEVSPYLEGRFEKISLSSLKPLKFSLAYGGEIERGGTWKPPDCKARKKVAFMIPLRNRWEQLFTFLNHMLPIFQRQQLHFRVFVVEQVS